MEDSYIWRRVQPPLQAVLFKVPAVQTTPLRVAVFILTAVLLP